MKTICEYLVMERFERVSEDTHHWSQSIAISVGILEFSPEYLVTHR